ncbi:hypothetical protein L2E82_24861 [Cichorium intybus]|uniref:Uncharacterized protein n=1 Tax=Cichorium intybus TaxID=13427 RepID=A0ACB9E1N4_CICIN|nr:hypothetical protein L2E82_24861 [Cichorium intybus]
MYVDGKFPPSLSLLLQPVVFKREKHRKREPLTNYTTTSPIPNSIHPLSSISLFLIRAKPTNFCSRFHHIQGFLKWVFSFVVD